MSGQIKNLTHIRPPDFLPKVANFKKMMIMKKTKKIEFRLTLTELKIIQNKASKCGCSISEFVRETSLGYEPKNKLTTDEIAVFNILTTYANNFKNLSNLFKLGDTTGVKELCVATVQEIRFHLNKLR